MKIAVLAAMEMEAAPLIRRMEHTSVDQRFLRGSIGKADAVLYRCGVGMRKAAGGARALIAYAQPDVLILYGISGGLVPDIQLHETVIGTSSFHKEHMEMTDKALADVAARVLPAARTAPLACARTVIIRKNRKTRLAKSGAVCVDMESFAVANASREAMVPLLVIRCISDTFRPASLLGFNNGKIAAEKAALAAEAVIKALANERTAYE